MKQTNTLIKIIIALFVISVIYYFCNKANEEEAKKAYYFNSVLYDLLKDIAKSEKELYGKVTDSTQKDLDSLYYLLHEYRMKH